MKKEKKKSHKIINTGFMFVLINKVFIFKSMGCFDDEKFLE
jgi:hypothetical protein